MVIVYTAATIFAFIAAFTLSLMGEVVDTGADWPTLWMVWHSFLTAFFASTVTSIACAAFEVIAAEPEDFFHH